MGREKPGKPRKPRREPDSGQEGMWINSDVDPVSGEYFLSISYEGDRIWALTAEEGWGYVRMVATQLARATYDAAVMRQFTERLGLGLEAVAGILGNALRPDRRPVDQVGPLVVEPGVNTEGKPFLHLRLDDELVGQWDIEDARHHILGIVEAIETVELDSQLRRVMLHSVGVEDHIARAFVNDLAEYRT